MSQNIHPDESTQLRRDVKSLDPSRISDIHLHAKPDRSGVLRLDEKGSLIFPGPRPFQVGRQPAPNLYNSAP